MKTDRLFKAVCVAFALTGCVSRAVNEGVQDRGPQVVAAPLPAGERMTIAIARFTNESTY